MSAEFSLVPDACVSCGGSVIKKTCQTCGNIFGTAAIKKEQRKSPRFFPAFSHGDIDRLRRKDDEGWKKRIKK